MIFGSFDATALTSYGNILLLYCFPRFWEEEAGNFSKSIVEELLHHFVFFSL